MYHNFESYKRKRTNFFTLQNQLWSFLKLKIWHEDHEPDTQKLSGRNRSRNPEKKSAAPHQRFLQSSSFGNEHSENESLRKQIFTFINIKNFINTKFLLYGLSYKQYFGVSNENLTKLSIGDLILELLHNICSCYVQNSNEEKSNLKIICIPVIT
jgi:hypothetical protein